MKAQKPAEGILKTHDWGDSKVYKIICDCGQDDHAHDVWVEASEFDVSVYTYVQVKSPWWSMNRFRQIWTLLTRGYLQHETVLTMTNQQALNYAETLKTAIREVEEFRSKRDVKN